MAPNKKVVLVIQSIREEGMKLMEARDDIDVRVLDSSDEDAILAAIPEAHGITVRVAKISRKIIEAAPNLQVVSRRRRLRRGGCGHVYRAGHSGGDRHALQRRLGDRAGDEPPPRARQADDPLRPGDAGRQLAHPGEPEGLRH